jgi:hypothetical protein
MPRVPTSAGKDIGGDICKIADSKYLFFIQNVGVELHVPTLKALLLLGNVTHTDVL